MLKFKKISFLSMLILVFLISACSQTSETQPPATQEPELSSSPTAEIEPTAVAEASIEEVEPTEEAVDYCLSCHTDKDELIDTAKPEEEVISESEGEG